MEKRSIWLIKKFLIHRSSSTSIRGLDKVLTGSYPTGSLIVIMGNAGSVKKDEMKRKIAVLKKRGSAHDKRPRYIDFKKGKVDDPRLKCQAKVLIRLKRCR